MKKEKKRGSGRIERLAYRGGQDDLPGAGEEKRKKKIQKGRRTWNLGEEKEASTLSFDLGSITSTSITHS